MLSTIDVELAGQALDLLVAELDPGEHTEMAHEIRGDFRHQSSLGGRDARAPCGARRPA